MGFARYRGTIRTVQDAMAADVMVVVTCQACGHGRRSRARRLYDAGPGLADAALGKPLPGFYCTACRGSVSVVITAGSQWS